MKYLICLIIFLSNHSGFAAIEQKAENSLQYNLKQVMRKLQNIYVRSNNNLLEFENNKKLNDAVTQILKKIEQNIIPGSSENLIDFIHLAQAQAHFYLLSDEIVKAHIVLKRARKAIEISSGLDEQMPLEQKIDKLVKISSRLPAYYALTLHDLGRIYFYEQKVDSKNTLIGLDCAANLMAKSVAIRKIIDNDPAHFHETYHPRLNNVSDSFVFKRRLGFILCDRGEYEQAFGLYQDLNQAAKDKYSRLLITVKLMQICSRRAILAPSKQRANSFFHEANNYALEGIELLKNVDWTMKSRAIHEIARFFMLDENPFRNLEQSQTLLDSSKILLESHTLGRSIAIELTDLMSDLYQKLAEHSRTQKLQKKNLWRQRHADDLIKNNAHGNIKISSMKRFFNWIAKIFLEKKLILEAAIIDSNGSANADPDHLEQLYNKYRLGCLNTITGDAATIHSWVPVKSQLQSYKKNITKVRRFTREEMEKNRPQAESIFAMINSQIIAIYSKMFSDTLKELGSPPASYSLVAFGSNASSTATPYSDFEYAIIIEDESKKTKDYFELASMLFKLRLILLNETSIHYANFGKVFSWTAERDSPLKAGISPDSGKLTLVGTLNYIADRYFDGAPNFKRLAIKNHRHVCGNHNLSAEFKKAIENKFTGEKQKMVLGQMLSSDLLRYDPSSLLYSSVGITQNIKHNYYRTVVLHLQIVALEHGIFEQEPWELVRKLREKSIITDYESEALMAALNKALLFRLRAHLKSDAQIDQWPLGELKQIEDLKILAQDIFGFRAILSSASKLPMSNEKLLQSGALLARARTQASQKKVHHALKFLKEAESIVKEVLLDPHPGLIEIYLELARVQNELGNFCESNHYLAMANKTIRSFFGELDPRIKQIEWQLIDNYIHRYFDF